MAPDELSFTSAEAWKEIMGHRKDSSDENAKDVVFSAGWENTILGANRDDHRRYRRILSNGFSAKAMMMKYVTCCYSDCTSTATMGKRRSIWFLGTTLQLSTSLEISPLENLSAVSTTLTTIRGYP